MSEKEKDTSKTQEELPEDEVENEGQDEGQEDNTKGEGIGEDVTSVYDDEDEAQDDSKDDSKNKRDKDDDGKKDDDKEDENDEEEKKDEGQDDDKSDEGQKGEEGKDADSKDGESDVDGSDAQKEAEGAEKGNNQPDAENDMSLQEPTENTGGNLGDTGSTDVPANSSNAAGSTAEGAGASGATGAEGSAGAAGAEGARGVFGIVLLVILIIFIIIGIFGFLTAIPSMTLEKLKEFAQGIWDGIEGYFMGADAARVNDDNVLEVAQYLYDMGYDLEGCGFVQDVEFEKDENGNSTGVIEKVKSSYLTHYLVAENRTYMISNDNFSWTDLFDGLTSGRITEGISSSWGSGMIHIDNGIWSDAAMTIQMIPIVNWGYNEISKLAGDVSVDRESNMLRISRNNFSSGLAFWNWRRDVTYYNLAGWSGRYGKPFELLVTLHLSTMAPDFANEIAMNEDLDTRVNIGLKNATFEGSIKLKKEDGTEYSIDQLEEAGYSQDIIDKLKSLENDAKNISTKTPYIKDVKKHWFRDVYFDTNGKSVEYGVVQENEDKKEETSKNKEDDEEKEDIQYVYEDIDGERKLKTTNGAVNVYETGTSSESFEYLGEIDGLDSGDKVIFEGTIADNIVQKQDGVRGVTNPTTKELFKGKYYIYDGTIEKANNIKEGKEEKQQIQFNDNSLSIFNIRT